MSEWQDMSSAPLDGSQFLAALSNGWVTIISGHPRWAKERTRYEWWRSSSGLSIPYEPSHPKDTNWGATDTLRATHWMPLPKAPNHNEILTQDTNKAS